MGWRLVAFMDTCSPVDSRSSIPRAGGSVVDEAAYKFHQLVGGFAHGGHDGDHLVRPACFFAMSFLRPSDALRRSDGRPEFAYDYDMVLFSSG